MPTLKKIAVLFASANAVAAAATCDSVGPTHATHFTYEDFGTYERVNSTTCSESYILYPRGQSAPNLGPGYKYFAVPLENVVLTQTPPVSFIEKLGKRSAVKVGSQYTTSPCMAKMVEDGAITKYVSFSDNEAEHEAMVGDESVEAIASDPYGTSKWEHAASASKIICAAQSYESTPLGQAEWIKFWGYFFKAKESATAQFCSTKTMYTVCNSYAISSNRAETAKVSAGITTSYAVPKAVFASQDWNGNFMIGMGPYKDQVIRDAGAMYPDLSAYDSLKTMHWSGSHVSGYNFGTDAAAFKAALSMVDVILDEGWPHGATKADMLVKYGLDGVDPAEYPRAIRNNKWYALDGTMDSKGPPYGGTDYFESRFAEPDGLLADLAVALHYSETSADLTYLRPMHDVAAIKVVTGSMCTDLDAPRRVRSATCAARLSELLLDGVPVAEVVDADDDSNDDDDDEADAGLSSSSANLETTGSSDSDASGINLTVILALAVACGVLFFVLGLVVAFYTCRQKDAKAIQAKQVQLKGVSTTSNAA